MRDPWTGRGSSSRPRNKRTERVKCREEIGNQNIRSRISGEIREGFKRRERSSDFRGKRGG